MAEDSLSLSLPLRVPLPFPAPSHSLPSSIPCPFPQYPQTTRITYKKEPVFASDFQCCIHANPNLAFPMNKLFLYVQQEVQRRGCRRWREWNQENTQHTDRWQTPESQRSITCRSTNILTYCWNGISQTTKILLLLSFFVNLFFILSFYATNWLN